jgi:hypothetical protein
LFKSSGEPTSKKEVSEEAFSEDFEPASEDENGDKKLAYDDNFSVFDRIWEEIDDSEKPCIIGL